ncbi:MAG: pseudouridine synthase [Sporolactobacillus sp.]
MERLQKVMAQAGVASRRKAEQLIIEGHVTVNGETVKALGTKVSDSDAVAVNGVPINREAYVYYLFYKPVGVISSVADDHGRRTVLDFFRDVPERLFPVGRLDYDTSGALLLTNDGALAYQLMHPRFEVDKTYIAKVSPPPTKEQLRKIAGGLALEDGMTAKATVELLKSEKDQSFASVRLTIHEGRNRQVRRMFASLNLHVRKLKRECYGFLTLNGLHPGDSRRLKPHEVKSLYGLINESRKADRK